MPETLRMAKQMVHMAAKGVGRFSFGLFGTVADYSDKDGIRSLVAEARRHGFDGASCIHPSVVRLLNEGFSPSEAEVAQAQRVIDVLDESEAKGLGAVSLDGKMIDKPVADRAKRLLERAKRSCVTLPAKVHQPASVVSRLMQSATASCQSAGSSSNVFSSLLQSSVALSGRRA